MKVSITEMGSKDLRCPVCGGTLSFKEVTFEDDGIGEGLLGCTDCCALYPICQGIPYLLSLDEMGPTGKPSIPMLHREREVQKSLEEVQEVISC